MGVYKLSANSVKNGRTIYGSMLAGNTAYTIPTSFESIATVTVGSGGASSVEFTSIPSTYTHLQIRGIARTNRTGYVIDNISIRYNSDSGTNYSWHNLRGGYNTTPQVTSEYSTSASRVYLETNTSVATNVFSVYVIDILDYANTNKNKTTRALLGFDCNGTAGTDSYGGLVALDSFRWGSNSAIDTITIYGDDRTSSNLTQYTSFALYGIKSA